MRNFLKVGILITFAFTLTQVCLAGIWKDNFSNNKLTEWQISNIVDWESIPNGHPAKWKVDNGKVYGSIHERGMESVLLTGKLTWRNYSVSCRAKFIGNKDETSTLGLTLHARNKENKRYMFLMNYFDQAIAIVAAAGRLAENHQGWTQEITQFRIEFNTWYLLSASILKNDQLQFEIKNLTDPNNKIEFRIRVKEPITEGGLTGFHVIHTDAVFDDIEIRGDNIPNRVAFPIEPQSKLATTWGKLKKR